MLMAKASILKELMFDERLPRYQDWDLFIRIGLKYEIGYLNNPLVQYNEGSHDRITNSVLGLPAAEMERQFWMIEKHKAFFGARQFRRHMCRALLYGITRRQNMMAHLVYVVGRYGLLNVVWTLVTRFRTRLRGRLCELGTMAQKGSTKGAA